MKETTPELRALIDAARDGVEPSAENRARVRWLVEQSLARETPGGRGVRAGSGARRLVALSVFGLTLAGSASAMALWWPASDGSPSVPALDAEEAPVGQVARAAERAPRAPALPLFDVVVTLTPFDAPAHDRRPQASPRGPVPSLGLAEEAALLAQAQTATNRGDAEAALRLLAEYDGRYASGALSQERSMARILALCASGQVDAARREAKGFGKRFPNSPQAARLGSTCATEPRSETAP